MGMGTRWKPLYLGSAAARAEQNREEGMLRVPAPSLDVPWAVGVDEDSYQHTNALVLVASTPFFRGSKLASSRTSTPYRPPSKVCRWIVHDEEAHAQTVAS